MVAKLVSVHEKCFMLRKYQDTPLVMLKPIVSYGAFRLPSFCIGQRLSTLVFCMATHITRTNTRTTQICCETLALAGVDRCTAMKSEYTIILFGEKKVLWGTDLYIIGPWPFLFLFLATDK